MLCVFTEGKVSKKLFIAVLVLLIILPASGCRDRSPRNTVNSPDEVAGKIIGAIEGSPSVLIAEELGVSAPYSLGSELMYHLKAGALDCVIMENSAASELVAETSGVRILSEPLLEYDLSFAVAKENAQLLNAVNTALATLRDNGTLGKLLDKYFAGRKYTYTTPDNVEPHPGHLSLAIPPDSPPYSYRDAEGRYHGLDVDIAQAVCDVLGVELRVVVFDTRDLVTAVWFGKADLALGWLPVEGEDKVAVSDAYSNTVHVVIVRR